MLADNNNALNYSVPKYENQYWPEIDGEKIPATARGRSDRAEKGPGGAIHRQRQAVYDGFVASVKAAGGLFIAPEGNKKQDRHIGNRDEGNEFSGQGTHGFLYYF